MYQILIDGELFCDSRVNDLAISDPVITNEVNKAGTFKFTIPPKHPYYNKIEKRISSVEVYRDDNTEPVFAGMAVEVTDDFFKQRHIVCEGEFAFFNDTVQRPHNYHGVTPRQLLESYINVHNSQVEATKRFTIGQVTVEDPNNYINCYTNYDSTMESLKEDLVDDLGGYFRIRHENGARILDYLAEAPRTNEQIIKLGENLIDFHSTLDTTKIATVIIPLGAVLSEEERTEEAIPNLDERVNIKSVNDGKDYIESKEAVKTYGWIEQVVTWNDVKTPSILKSKAQKYLQDTQFENLVIEAKAVDLNIADSSVMGFKLLDNIRVLSKPHGLDRNMMLTKQTINLNNPENDTIVLGIDEVVSISSNTRKINEEVLKKIDLVPTTATVLSAVNNATALLKGNEGGHIKIVTDENGKPQEILIMDTDDITTATKIWRWNQNGLGFSDDGGETYGLALTQDGAIVADRITSGSMTADRIQGGKLSLGGVDNVNGQIYIYNAEGVVCGIINNSGIAIFSQVTNRRVLITPDLGIIQTDSEGNDFYGLTYSTRFHLPAVEGDYKEKIIYRVANGHQTIEATLLDYEYEPYEGIVPPLYRNWRGKFRYRYTGDGTPKWQIAQAIIPKGDTSIDIKLPEAFEGKQINVSFINNGSTSETINDAYRIEYDDSYIPTSYFDKADGTTFTDTTWGGWNNPIFNSPEIGKTYLISGSAYGVSGGNGYTNALDYKGTQKPCSITVPDPKIVTLPATVGGEGTTDNITYELDSERGVITVTGSAISQNGMSANETVELMIIAVC